MFSFFRKIRKINEMERNEKALKARLEHLEEHVSKLEHGLNHVRTDISQFGPPIFLENVHVDRIYVDKIEYTNNFGALGIKELSGSLNIGANYGLIPKKSEGSKQKAEGSMDTAKPSNKADEGKQEASPSEIVKGPKVNIKKRPAD